MILNQRSQNLIEATIPSDNNINTTLTETLIRLAADLQGNLLILKIRREGLLGISGRSLVDHASFLRSYSEAIAAFRRLNVMTTIIARAALPEGEPYDSDPIVHDVSGEAGLLLIQLQDELTSEEWAVIQKHGYDTDGVPKK